MSRAISGLEALARQLVETYGDVQNEGEMRYLNTLVRWRLGVHRGPKPHHTAFYAEGEDPWSSGAVAALDRQADALTKAVMFRAR